MEQNTRQSQIKYIYNHIYQRRLDPIVSIPLSLGLLAFFSGAIAKNMFRQNLFINMRNAIKKAYPINLAAERNLENKLVYCSGNLLRQNQTLAREELLDISSSDIKHLGIYRKVEVFQKKMFRSEDQSWFNTVSTTGIQQNQFKTALKSEVKTNGRITLKDHELDNVILVDLANQNTQKRNLDIDKLQNIFYALKQKSQQSNKDIQQDQNLKYNPFIDLEIKGYQFTLKDDYIYLQMQKNRNSEGDIRISYYDVNNITEVTLLAAKHENLFKQYELDYGIYQVLDVGRNIINTLFFNSTTKRKQFAFCSAPIFAFITSKQLSSEDIISSLAQQYNKNINRNILIYSIILFSLHFYINTNIIIRTDLFDDEPKSDRIKEISQELASNKEYPLEENSTNNILIKNLLYSLAFSGLNISLLKLMSKGYIFNSMFIAIICIEPLASEIIKSFELQLQIKEEVQKYKNKNLDSHNKNNNNKI